MKKVLFVATVTIHINSFHIPYLKWFKEQGYEVHVASNGDEEIKYCDKHYNLPFERFPLKSKNYKAYKELKKIINENEYEIIHCHTPVGGVLTRLAAKKARKKYNTRVIYTAHGFHFYKGAPVLNWMIYYPLEKWLSKYTDTLITINQEDYERAKKHFEAKNIELVHGVGVDEEKFKFTMTDQEKTQLREELGVKQDEFVIIYIAELSKRKNQGMLLEAIKELKNEGQKIKVLLPGKDSLNGYYQQMAKKLKIQENIKFLGYRKDIPQLLEISDLYVSTSKQEGLPVNIMEAMFLGLPIIATDCRGNCDLVQNDVNGYIVEIGDTLGLNKKILELKKNKEKCVAVAKNNYEKCKKYKLDIILRNMKNIYLGKGENNDVNL